MKVGARRVRIEQERLGAIVPGRDGGEHLLHRVGIGHVAAAQERQGAQAERAAQHLAAIDAFDQRLVLGEQALIDRTGGAEPRSGRRTNAHGHSPV